MTIEKLPSGSYRIKQMYKGKYYSVTIDHKPTKREASILIGDALREVKEADTGDMRTYISKYIELCVEEGKSPTTVKNYRSILRNLPEGILNADMSSITSATIQKYMNIYGEGRSAKTVQNAYGLISAVLSHYRPSFKCSINLPKREESFSYEPTTHDIAMILRESEGTRYEAALKLAALGLRRGEALAIDPSTDIDKYNVLTISKAIALNEDNLYEIKSTKTTGSVRRITLPQDLADLLRRQGYVFDGNPHTINETLHKYQDKLGIPRFKLHMMRHFAAAYMHKAGMSDEQIMQWCGWTCPSTMARTYRYNLDPEEAQKKITSAFSLLMDNRG